jgi:hypothetical protein
MKFILFVFCLSSSLFYKYVNDALFSQLSVSWFNVSPAVSNENFIPLLIHTSVFCLRKIMFCVVLLDAAMQ